MKKKVTIATVFSGIGAIEQAFLQLKIKHQIIFACDIDKFVKQSYLANYSPKKWYDDICKIDGKKYLNKIDLFVGGSPCQSFSLLGNRKGIDDLRGILIFEFIRLIKEIKPKNFIFENVKGLKNHNKGKTWELVFKKFKQLGYKVDFRLLNAKDYGIPQSRPRLFLIGKKDNRRKINFPATIKLEKTLFDFLELTVNDKYYISDKGKRFVLNNQRLKKRYTQYNGKVALCQTVCQQYNLNGDFVSDEYIKKYVLWPKTQKFVLSNGTKNFRVKPTINREIAHTLTATMHKMHRASFDNYVTYKNDRIRKLTPKECLRLMGFDDDFKKVVSDTQLYRQSGNSIVVDILKFILINNKDIFYEN